MYKGHRYVIIAKNVIQYCISTDAILNFMAFLMYFSEKNFVTSNRSFVYRL